MIKKTLDYKEVTLTPFENQTVGEILEEVSKLMDIDKAYLVFK